MTQNTLTHIDETGAARMVDIADKVTSTRRALAEGFLLISAETQDKIWANQMPKGDTLAVARVAGIMGAKRTSELIPLCHPLALSKLEVSFERTDRGIRILAEVRIDGKTGVEMEALTAVSVAGLTLYDMVKAVEKSAILTDIRLLEKDGGKSGQYRAEDKS